jgi:hypothetical protein
MQLGRDQRLLVELCAFQPRFLIGEIGHGVLPVLVEEQLVELAVKVIVMLHIPAGARAVVELVHPPARLVDHPFKLARLLHVAPDLAGLRRGQQHQITDIMRRLDHHPSAHIGLARAQRGVAAMCMAVRLSVKRRRRGGCVWSP